MSLPLFVEAEEEQRKWVRSEGKGFRVGELG